LLGGLKKGPKLIDSRPKIVAFGVLIEIKKIKLKVDPCD
jgi:hypothetical protein